MLYRLFFQKYNAPSSLKGIEKYDLKLTRLEGEEISYRSIGRLTFIMINQRNIFNRRCRPLLFIINHVQSILKYPELIFLMTYRDIRLLLFIHNNKNEITV